MKRAILVAATLVAVALTCACASSDKKPDAIETVVESTETTSDLAVAYWEMTMAASPGWATSVGDHRYDDKLGMTGPEANTSYAAKVRALLERVRAVTPSAKDKVTHSLLELQLSDSLRAHEVGLSELAVDQMSGPQAWMPYFFTVEHPMKTSEDAKNLASRFKQVPRYMDGLVDSLKAGMLSGRVAPKVLVERVIRQVDALTSAEPSVFERAADRASDDAMKAELKALAKSDVVPAFKRYNAFLKDTYLAKSRESIGLSDMPRGKEAYAYLAQHHTTTTLTPEEIHEIGKQEIERIAAQLTVLAKKAGKEELGPWGYMSALKDDTAFRAGSRDALFATFGDALKRADQKLPEAFGRLPKLGYEVKPMDKEREKDAPAAYYQPGSVKDARKGIFVANLYRFEERPTFNSEVLAFHEAVPGHHLQIAIAQELGGLPTFRREMGVTAFVEGWGLYSEQLADELGLYSSDEARVGYLGYRAWRASRLVVDTGMHALGWSRDDAIKYLASHTTLGDIDVENEIDRYIAMPGQALAYMVGCLRINKMRERAKRELGDDFDLKVFHDAVLGEGALPLEILDAHVSQQLNASRAE